jgi:hypothetical protein
MGMQIVTAVQRMNAEGAWLGTTATHAVAVNRGLSVSTHWTAGTHHQPAPPPGLLRSHSAHAGSLPQQQHQQTLINASEPLGEC